MGLSASDIRRAFDALSTQLRDTGERGEIIVVGGAALVLLFGAREATKDVDAYFLSPKASQMRTAIANVGNELDLPEDWMNDAAKGFFMGITIGTGCMNRASSLLAPHRRFSSWR